MGRPFAARLIDGIRSVGNPLCLGLDPYSDRIPLLFGRADAHADPAERAATVGRFCEAVLDVAAGRVAIVKPQASLFERHGWEGVRALDGVVRSARRRGFLVLLDAKRGDIGETAEGYAAAYLGRHAPLPVDAITVNPYMGLDAVEPFVKAAEAGDQGVVVLVRNSNPGATVFQDARLANGTRIFQVVAAALGPFEAPLTSPGAAWSSLAVTVAATRPDDSELIRALLPRSLFLVLGYGAQGGSAHDAVRGFVRGPAGREGGIVNASRSILFPDDAREADAAGWARSIGRALERAIDPLRKALEP